MIYFYNLRTIKKTHISKNVGVIIIKRNMMRGTSIIGTKVCSSSQNCFFRAGYSLKKFKDSDSLTQEDNQPLPLHLKTHAVSYNEKSGTVEGIFTSAKKFSKVDETNYNGETKAQYLAPLKNARKVDPNMLEDIPNGKTYHDKHKDKIEDILERSNVRGQNVIKVFKDKDDE